MNTGGRKTYQIRPPIAKFITAYYNRRSRHPADSVTEVVAAVMAKELTPEEAEELMIDALRRRDEVLSEYISRLAKRAGKNPVAKDLTESATNRALQRLPLTDACIEYLRLTNGPKKPANVCKGLLAAGRDFSNENPRIAVASAMRKGALTHDDLVYVGSGEWTLKSKYTPSELKKLVNQKSGRGGRSPEEHARKTKEGMIAAGLTFGRKPKFGPDDIAKFRKLVPTEVDGKKNRNVIAALGEVGISTPYYYAYKDEIYAWKPGEPWPPPGGFPQGVSGDELRRLGVIPMPARLIGEKK
jgi:hypothetical protein